MPCLLFYYYSTVIGPLLFWCYIADLLKLQIKSKINAYADDNKLSGTPGQILQSDLRGTVFGGNSPNLLIIIWS